MKVYVVMKKEGHNSTVIHCIFLTKIKADKYIGPQDTKATIPCGCCGQQRPNPVYNELETWKQKLYIEEWEVYCR